MTFVGCRQSDDMKYAQVAGGNASYGQHLIYSYNCGACHVIPGIAEAKGTVGPTLAAFGNRNYVAGLLVNTPENLSRWIREPQKIDGATAMPDLGVTPEHAADIAEYLYTLR